MEKGKSYNLAAFVEYSKDAIVSKILLKEKTGNITLFAFDKNQGLSEHSAPFDAFVQVVEGTGEITIAGTMHQLHEGEGIIMPANIPHAVHTTSGFKMLLTMIRSESGN